MEQDTVSLILNGFFNSLEPYHLVLMSLGMIGGIIAGALPGLTATMAIALLVPVTFAMRPESGLVMLGAIWCGAIYGGSNAAILLRIPGTPSSIATTFDGYPMTLKGQADKALFLGLLASVIGGIVGVLVLLVAFAPLARFSLSFSKPEYFWLCIFGLTSIAAMSSQNIIKGLLGAALGLLMGTVGMDPLEGVPRFTFGYWPLVEGLELVPVMIGIFAFAQMLSIVETEQKYIADYARTQNLVLRVLTEVWAKCKANLVRSSIIGTVVGMLPGAGGPVASIIAYNEAVRWDKDPGKYGKGAIEGIIASESANNAVIGGSLIPMMSLGIPGCPAAAVVMGGLLAHGIIPGSKLLVESGDVAYTFIASLVTANIIMLVIGYVMLKGTANILRVPARWVAPIILILSVIGSFAIRNSLLDVFVMAGSGIFSYLLAKVGVDPGPLSLGVVLGPIAEEALGVSLIIAGAKGSVIDILVFRPICLALILLSILSALTPMFLSYRRKRTNRKTGVSS